MDEWPQTDVKMRGGRKMRWAQVNAPAGASTEIAWENIAYAQAETILAAWDANYGLYGSVTLVADTLSGLDAGLAAVIQQPFPGAVWRAEEPPVVEAVKAGRCIVRLRLRTRRNIGGGNGGPVQASYRLTITSWQGGQYNFDDNFDINVEGPEIFGTLFSSTIELNNINPATDSFLLYSTPDPASTFIGPAGTGLDGLLIARAADLRLTTPAIFPTYPNGPLGTPELPGPFPPSGGELIGRIESDYSTIPGAAPGDRIAIAPSLEADLTKVTGTEPDMELSYFFYGGPSAWGGSWEGWLVYPPEWPPPS